MKKSYIYIVIFLIGMITAFIPAHYAIYRIESVCAEYQEELKISNEEIIRLTDALFEATNNEWISLGEFKITYYWPGEDQWGSITSTGITAKEGRTIAVDPTVIPYGTEVMIDNHIYIAEDCGGAVKGNVIDIFVNEPRMERHFNEVYVKE